MIFNCISRILRASTDHRHSRGNLTAAISSVCVLLLACSTNAWSFGSARILSQNEEHARITQAALGCGSQFDPSTKPNPCFEPKTLSNLAGFGPLLLGAFPAVEAPDNMAMHWTGGPDWWHCDKGDFLDSAGYPQSRPAATQKLLDCRFWAQRMLDNGLIGNDYCETTTARRALKSQTWLCSGVTARAHLMLNGKGKVDVSQPDFFSIHSGCSFNGKRGRIKCEVLQQFGYALHTLQDFYSHSNLADQSIPPPTWQNPPGIGSTSLPAFWDMTNPNGDPSLLPNPNLSSGCYPDSECIKASRTAHEYLNKDKCDIDAITGVVTNPRTPRGQLITSGVSNAQLAVSMAIAQTRSAWANLQQLIIQKEGSARGAKIICAIASDTPDKCGTGKSSAAAVPEEDITEPDKVAPYDWVLRELQAEDDNLEALRNGSIAQSVEIGPSGVVGITNSATLNCGDTTVNANEEIPEIGILTAFDLTVAGTSCKHALKLLRQYHAFNASGGEKGSAPAPKIQCVTMATNPDPNSNDARIVCKNKDESIEMSFFPTCPDQDGDCGI